MIYYYVSLMIMKIEETEWGKWRVRSMYVCLDIVWGAILMGTVELDLMLWSPQRRLYTLLYNRDFPFNVRVGFLSCFLPNFESLLHSLLIFWVLPIC